MSKMIAVKIFVEQYTEEQVEYDERFQRRVVWTDKQSSEFIKSLTMGRAKLTNIVLAEVQSCLDHSKKRNDEISIEYYEGLHKQGKRFISLDGQNRTKKVCSFINNEYSISGEFRDADGVMVPLKEAKWAEIKQKHPRLADAINDSTLNIEYCDPCVSTDLPYIFCALNSGTPLNRQELRNSFQTPVAEHVRHMSKTAEYALRRFIKPKYIVRREDDRIMAITCMNLFDNSKSKSKQYRGWAFKDDEEFDAFYLAGEKISDIQTEDSPYSEEDFSKSFWVAEKLNTVIKEQNTFTAPSQYIALKHYWPLIWTLEYMYDNNINLEKEQINSFFETLVKTNNTLYLLSKKEFSKFELQSAKIGRTVTEGDKHGFYFRQIGIIHQHNTRAAARTTFLDEFKKEYFSSPTKLKIMSAK